MEKRRTSNASIPFGEFFPGVMILSASFLLGTVLGCLAAGGVGESETGPLTNYIQRFLLAAREGRMLRPEFPAILWETVRWPLLTVLFSFTVLGLAGIPALFFLRGFLLSFAVASFVRVLGGEGMVLALLIFGTTAVISIPVIFVLGMQGFSSCRRLALRLLEGKRSGAAPAYGQTFYLRCGLCSAALLVSVFFEWTVLPSLLFSAMGTL